MQWKRKKSQRADSGSGAVPAGPPDFADYTPTQLQDCNDLTRLSVIPGQLAYEAYAQFLALLGHVQPHQSFGLNLPQEPQNSNLQTTQDDHNPAQEDSKAMDDVSPNNADGVLTSWRADQALWSEQNLPEILYCFDRPEAWLALKDLREPPLKIYQVNGIQLRDIPILPDHISSNLEGWRHVAWTRMDPRIFSKDINDRMRTQTILSASRSSRKQLRGQNSTIQMRTARFREDFPALGWVKKGGNFEKDRRNLKARLEAAGVCPSRNTTRGVSWGLIDKVKGDIGGRIPVAETKSWPTSVEQQPDALPNLQTSVSFATTESLLGFTNRTLNVPFTRSVPRSSHTPTPEEHVKMSILSASGGLNIKRERVSSSDIIMDTPRKRRKTTKFEEGVSSLTPVVEMPLYTPEQENSDKDPFKARYAHTQAMLDLYGAPETKNNQRRIPHDIMKYSDNEITPRPTPQELFARKMQELIAQAAARNAARAELDEIKPNTTFNGEKVVTIEYGGSVLTLKTYWQRANLSHEDRTLLTTFHPAGTGGRNRQLEFLLDPDRAPFGFQDCNGYEAPVAGVDLNRRLEFNIWY